MSSENSSSIKAPQYFILMSLERQDAVTSVEKLINFIAHLCIQLDMLANHSTYWNAHHVK